MYNYKWWVFAQLVTQRGYLCKGVGMKLWGLVCESEGKDDVSCVKVSFVNSYTVWFGWSLVCGTHNYIPTNIAVSSPNQTWI